MKEKLIKKRMNKKSMVGNIIKRIFLGILILFIVFFIIKIINLNGEVEKLNNQLAPDSVLNKIENKDTLVSSKDSNTYILIRR